MLRYNLKTKNPDIAILVLLFLLMITFFFNNSFSSFANESSTNYYIIGQNDVLEIMLWGYPELTRTAVVQPDGMISLPLGGQIDAAGKTLVELRAGIVKELKKTLTALEDTQVSVSVVSFGTFSISVLGK